jgi:uncharacterized protein (UPF0332 family)
MSDTKPPDAPARRRRTLPRGGKWPDGSARSGSKLAVEPPRKAECKAPARRAPNPAQPLWAKARQAARSARLLRDAGDLDGAANRAYYAVFAAARAALASARASRAQSKGHGTILRRFEKHLIAERGFDAELGRRFIGRLSHVRWVADYDVAGTDREAVAGAIADADRFLVAIEPFVKKAKA